MKREEFCEALGDINESYIKEARERRRVWVRWCAAAAACLCLALLGGILYSSLNSSSDIQIIQSSNADTVVSYTYVEVGDRIACYHGIPADQKDLIKLKGSSYDGGAWFSLKDKNNIKYLIKEDSDGSLTLWVFSDFVVTEFWDEGSEAAAYFESEYPNADLSSYTYGEVLETIYGVTSSDDILSITASPSIANNTDLGKKIQKEIGTHTYNDREDIEAFYSILKNTVCYGTNEVMSEGNIRFEYSFSTDEQDKLTSGEDTYAIRYITLTLRDGTTVDSIKYTALQGKFFEYGGIYSKPLDEEDVYTINEIFGIE